MKTFVYHDGGLGDMLLSIPCLEKLRAGSGWIHLAGRGDVARFLKETGLVDAAVSSDQALFASLYSAVDPQLRTFLSGFDRACVFTTEDNSAAAGTIRTIIPHTITVRTIPTDGSQMHAALYRLSQLDPDTPISNGQPLGGAPSGRSRRLLSTTRPPGTAYSRRLVLHGREEALSTPSGSWGMPRRGISMPQENAHAAHTLLRGAGYKSGMHLIAVHPGSGGRMKCWPFEQYIELIERLHLVNDSFVILFTGEAEDGGLRKTVERYAHGRKNMFHAVDLELMTAASLLSLCGLYIGNDSGFSHLAGMLGCAAIVLFGPTDPLRWKPLGQRVHVVSTSVGKSMKEITVDEVMERVDLTRTR